MYGKLLITDFFKDSSKVLIGEKRNEFNKKVFKDPASMQGNF